MVAAVVWAPAAQSADLPDVTSLMGLRTDTGAGWFAVLVPEPPDSAVSGVKWYNNDSTTAFPGLLVATGLESGGRRERWTGGGVCERLGR